MSRRRDTQTLDLLAWQPPEPVRAFPPEKVRAASLRSAVAKAVSLALKECGRDRDDVAQAMGEYLGEACPKTMLDAYASEAREEHVINVVRFIALMHATGDRRLLQLLAEPFGLAVIDARYLPAIEDALLDDKIAELTQRRQFARRRWKGA
ncbi:DNA transposition protein [Azospirillum sp. INR13]|uniref:DNA transposition protein n=1 Tax=Azospirillum sp. INR13 TaxID=2596919 RepID=UPI0018927FBB|nr:DNA transposition protein [Azospirillum sp. INR13]MBF5095298.1 DNA transposition protein [Azospirillum sp. INR13]